MTVDGLVQRYAVSPGGVSRGRQVYARAVVEAHDPAVPASDPDWSVHCVDCETRLARYRRSTLVTDPEAYRCGDCGGRFRVERND